MVLNFSQSSCGNCFSKNSFLDREFQVSKMLTPKFEWEENEERIKIQVVVKGTNAKDVDIYGRVSRSLTALSVLKYDL